jgi:hypothetical protein
LTLRPYVGLRGGLISQNYNQSFFEEGANGIPPPFVLEGTDRLKMKNDFHGGGLLAGVETQWGLFKEISLYGNGTASLLYGHFKVNRHEIVQGKTFDDVTGILLQIDNHTLHASDSFCCCRAITDLALGLKWDHMFAKNRIHLGINVGWEEHLLFGQNQFYGASASSLPINNDLTIQGWVFGARLDF